MLGNLGLMKDVAKFLAKQFKLDKMEKIIEYVEGENELDLDVKEMKEDTIITKQESISRLASYTFTMAITLQECNIQGII